MKLQAQDGKGNSLHLTYCTNIHPAESWPDVLQVVKTHVRAVKQRVSPHGPFGIGLRLSARAARELAESAKELASFKQYLDDNGLYVFTLNGFPYGPFHGQSVKEAVYRPDWLETERLVYTANLGTVLAALLPAQATHEAPLDGSISTVPGCFRGRATTHGSAPTTIAQNLRHAATNLVAIRAAGGPTIGLALEPEPHCAFETTHEMLDFFEHHLFTDASASEFAALTGLDRAEAAVALRRHLGICLDACHAAVEYESPRDTLHAIAAAGVSVFKLQVSAGLRMERPDDAAVRLLHDFVEGVYLHQTVVRRGSTLVRHLDLPDALAAAKGGDVGDEWRVHFHVPIFTEKLADDLVGFSSTSSFLSELLRAFAEAPLTPHLEVETYTWNVLPPALRTLPIDEAIAKELAWTMAELGTRPVHQKDPR